ncbi:SWR1 complex subunit 2 [Citrus sinensis]|uniref:SWR1 complex subunit 2 n=1 Tax=Citrus sinensis TaxID=2711 RepID=A0ACB8JQ35_CITSI|nr:SWR1 complex subunit 2 [Citrus sinensis]
METGTSSKEDAPVFLDRSSRVTRGKRMNKLLDDENEEDEAFWNQDALKEEENDDNYEEEQEIADEFDSDFDEDEPEPDEEGENEVDERVRTKKRLIFPGKPLTKKKKKKKILSKLDSPDKDVKSNEQSILPENHDVPNDVEGERIIRKSTRTAVVVRQAERDAIRAALQATMKPIKRKKEGEEKRITQEEMLLEAAQTEIMNLRNLERVLAREEEVKKRAIVHKAVYTGPQLRYLSKDGYSYLEFSKGVSFQSELSTTSVPYPERAVCAVTGLPAKNTMKRTTIATEEFILLWTMTVSNLLQIGVGE